MKSFNCLFSTIRDVKSATIAIPVSDLANYLKTSVFDPERGYSDDLGIQRFRDGLSSVDKASQYILEDKNARFPALIAADINGEAVIVSNDEKSLKLNGTRLELMDGYKRFLAYSQALSVQEGRDSLKDATQIVEILLNVTKDDARDYFALFNNKSEKLPLSHTQQQDANILSSSKFCSDDWKPDRVIKAILSKVAQKLNNKKGSPWYRCINITGTKSRSKSRLVVSSECVVTTKVLYKLAIDDSLTHITGVDINDYESVINWIVKMLDISWSAWREILPEGFTVEALKTHVVRSGMGMSFNLMLPSILYKLLKDNRNINQETIVSIIRKCTYLTDEGFWARGSGGAVAFNSRSGMKNLAEMLWRPIQRSMRIRSKSMYGAKDKK